jgi:hypothetical protein
VLDRKTGWLWPWLVDRVSENHNWLNRAQDEPIKKRLARELEDIDIQLAKVQRGLLH